MTAAAAPRPPTVAEVRGFYDGLNAHLSSSPVGPYAVFLNYGYVSTGDGGDLAPIELPRHALHRNSIRLVLETVGDCPLGPGDAVLDVGCGRGGAVAVLRRALGLRRVIGVDLSTGAVAFARRAHRRLGAPFLAGDAQAIPLASGRFDIVLNLESSHGYPEPERFYREVGRLLRPGGRFLWADLLSPERLAAGRAALAGLGFAVERERDLTANVLRSCDETARTHARALGERPEPGGALADFLGVPGTPTHDLIRRGEHRYVALRLRKEA